MKLKRLTITKKFIKVLFLFVPLFILYHWTPEKIEEEGKIVFIIITILAYNFGKFVGKAFTEDENTKN